MHSIERRHSMPLPFCGVLSNYNILNDMTGAAVCGPRVHATWLM